MKIMRSIQNHQVHIYIQQHQLQLRLLILMIIVDYLNVVHKCELRYIYLNYIGEIFRLLKSISKRISASSTTPYNTFLNNSIELVHVAKVCDKQMNFDLILI